jgi:arsenate reductase
MMEKNIETENKRKKQVLFVCTHNASRSQMAEGLLRALRGELYDVYSAGTAPTEVHPMAVAAMTEIGIGVR